MANNYQMGQEHMRARWERSGAIARVREPMRAHEWIQGPLSENREHTGRMLDVDGEPYFVLRGETQEGIPYVVVTGRFLDQQFDHEGTFRTVNVQPVGSRNERNHVERAVMRANGLEGHINFW
jgi:hypothetical protein